MGLERKSLAVLRVLRETAAASHGATLLWLVGAMLLLGGLGAAVSVMTPSTTQSKLEQEAAMRAYYNANAGLNFIKSMEKSNEVAKVNYATFISEMGGGDVVTYAMAGGGEFSFQINSVNSNGANGNYVITNLVGSIGANTNGSRYSYIIYGAGKGISENSSYQVEGPKSVTGQEKYVFSGGVVNISASAESVDGSIYGRTSVTLVEDATVTGDVVSNGNVKMGSRVKVNGSVCSDGSIVMAEENVVGGSVNAKSNVTMESRTSTGPITAGGNLVLSGSGQVINGDINAAGDVTISSSGKVNGSIYAAGAVTVNSAGGVVTGDIHAGGAITINSKITIGGGVFGGSVVTMANDSISVGLDVNAASSVSFTGYGGNYPGNVYANGAINIPQKTTISKNIASGGNITISGWSTCIKGVASAKGSIEACSGSSCGSGDCYIGSRLPNQAAVKAPTAPTSPSKYVACTVEPVPNPPKNEKTTDGALVLKRNKTKTFTEGIYYFSSISGEGNATVAFDLSKGDIAIFSTGAVSLGNPTNILVSTDGSTYKELTDVDKSLAAKIYLESNSSIFLDWKADWFGTLFSRGNITFAGGNTFIGSYASQSGSSSVNSGSGYSMTYVPSNYAIANWY